MEKVHRYRRVFRGGATRLLASANELLQDTDSAASDLQVAIEDLEETDTVLSELDAKIEELLDDQEYEDEIAGALEYHERIRHAITKLRFTLKTKRVTPTDVGQPGVFPPSDQSRGTSAGIHGELDRESTAHVSFRSSTQRVALPKLQIPVFSGVLREWQGFWEHFQATIHTHPELPNIEKFKYLKTYLSGDAKRAVEWIRLTESNYEVAIKVLTDRFGRTDVLVDDHIDSLLAIAPIESSAQVSRLRDLYEQVLFRTSCLEGLGVPTSEYAVILHRVIMRALPEDLEVLYRQRMKETAADDSTMARSRADDVNRVMRFLQIQVESREESRATRTRTRLKASSTDPNAQDCVSPKLPSALASATGSSSPEQRICPLCDAPGHKTEDCHANLSREEKRRRLERKRCCFRCGKSGHIARRCRTAAWLRCRHCSRNHLTVLCDVWTRTNSNVHTPAAQFAGISKRQRPKRKLIFFRRLEPNSKVNQTIQQRVHEADVREPAEIRGTQRQCLTEPLVQVAVDRVRSVAGRVKEVASRFDMTGFSDVRDNKESSSGPRVPVNRSQRPSLLPTTEPPHPRRSYYPSYKDRQDRLRNSQEAEQRKRHEGRLLDRKLGAPNKRHMLSSKTRFSSSQRGSATGMTTKPKTTVNGLMPSTRM